MIEQINLIPDEIMRKKKAGQKRSLVLGILILYVAGLGMIYFYQKAKIKERFDNTEQARKQRDELIAQNARYKEVIERINLAQKKEEDIKKRLAVIDSLLQGRVYWSEILRGVTNLIPDGIWLTSLSTYDVPQSSASGGGKGVKFNGTAFSNSRIAEFVFTLENSRFFKNVLLAYSQKKELQGKDLYDFEITAELKKTMNNEQ